MNKIKRKISVTTGTRAEYGLLRSVLEEIKLSKKLELFLIVAGMHLSSKHGLTINEIKKDGFKIHSSVDMIPKGDSLFHMATSLGTGVMEFSKIFKKLKPDINLILGDRDEVLASALSASHMNIPNAHIHGGDKTQAGIDEYNRHAITKLSNIHFAATKMSKQRIIKMGEKTNHVYFTGSPGIDAIKSNKITTKNQLEKKYNIKLTGNEILLLQHPVTTQYQQSKQQIKNTLKALSKLGKPIIAISPNSDSGNKAIFEQLQLFAKTYDPILIHKSIPRSDFLGLLKNCLILVGNSSSGIIEGGYFNIPVINIGIRQKDRERGKNVFDVESDNFQNILSTIKKAIKLKNKNFGSQKLYGDGNASKKIIKILETISLEKKLIQKQIAF